MAEAYQQEPGTHNAQEPKLGFCHPVGKHKQTPGHTTKLYLTLSKGLREGLSN